MSVCNKCVVINLVCLLMPLACCYNGMLPENYILNKEWLKNMSLYQDLIEKHTEVTKEDSLTPEIQLHLITPNCDLWNAADDENPFKDYPYFAFYWAGGQGLSRYILDHPEIVRGLRVLDLGSGCGATAIAAAIAGAKSVTANDIDPVSCVAIDMNARLNNVTVNITYVNLIGKTVDAWDVVFIGDMLYEPYTVRDIIPWLTQFVKQNKIVYLGDPGRYFIPRIRRKYHLKRLSVYSLPKLTRYLNNGFTTTRLFRFFIVRPPKVKKIRSTKPPRKRKKCWPPRNREGFTRPPRKKTNSDKPLKKTRRSNRSRRKLKRSNKSPRRLEKSNKSSRKT